MNEGLIEKYLRKDKLPHIWCSGCGNGIILKALVEAIDASGLKKEEICIVGGIGCSSRAAQYMNFDTVHTLHGRAIPYATGIKLANPKMKVIVLSGDGDATAIGGNHLIHGCRRNIDLTVIVFNNNIYGMTGGQASPTTPKDARTTTSEDGNICRDFDICKLCEAAGATYVARSTISHYNHLVKSIGEAISKNGFSVVEALTTCPVQYGRRNKLKKPSDMMKLLKNGGATNEKLKIGVFKDENEDEFVTEYLRHIQINNKSV